MILLLLFTATGSTLLLNTNPDNNLLFNATTTKMLVICSYGKDNIDWAHCTNREDHPLHSF